jgi:hypothetical protein
MNKLFKMYGIFIVCALAIIFISCTENRVDKIMDETDYLLSRFDKLSEEQNPSREEIGNLERDSKKFQESLLTLKEIKETDITFEQKKRFLNLMNKVANISNNRKYQNLQRLIRQYHINY